MARGKKGGNPRVTPKKTRPRNWDSGPSAEPFPVSPLSPVSPLAPPSGMSAGLPPGAAASALPDLEELFPEFDIPEAVFRDAEAASFVAGFAAEGDQPSIEEIMASPTPPEPDGSLSATQYLGALELLGPALPQTGIDSIAAIAVYGEPDAKAMATEMLKRFSPPSAFMSVVGQARVVDVRSHRDIFEESTQYAFELSYPDGSSGAYSAYIDHLDGGIIAGDVVVPSIEVIEELMTATNDGTVMPRPCSLEQAAAELHHAAWITSVTIGVEPPEYGPLLDAILDQVDFDSVDDETLNQPDRADLIRRFEAWVSQLADPPSDDVADWASLAIDFVSDYRGNSPMAWGPNTALAFLDWSTRKVMASPEELREIPDMLRYFVRWAHSEKGWGETHLPVVLEAIDEAEPMFEQEITSGPTSPTQQILASALAGVDMTDPDAIGRAIAAYNDSLPLDPSSGPSFGGLLGGMLGGYEQPTTVPPAGGSHPEPFDADGLGSATKRATEIADLAANVARALFDDEYVTLVRRLVTDAAREDETLFARGKIDIWSSGVIYAVAQLTHIVGQTWTPTSMHSEDLTDRLAGAHGTIVNKARSIRDAIGADVWSQIPRYTHSSTLFDFSDMFSNMFGGGAQPQESRFGPGPLGSADLFGGDDGPLDDATLAPVVPLRRPQQAPEGDVTGSLELRCELVGSDVWRTVIVPAAAQLQLLHHVMQVSFEWLDCHLYEFEAGSARYSSPAMLDVRDDPEITSDMQVKVGQLVGPDSAPLSYVYDFGDYWQVSITATRRLDEPQDHPVTLVDGAGDPPPEDCGGIWGFENLLAALADPAHPDHQDRTDWAGDFRPGSFSVDKLAARIKTVFAGYSPD